MLAFASHLLSKSLTLNSRSSDNFKVDPPNLTSLTSIEFWLTKSITSFLVTDFLPCKNVSRPIHLISLALTLGKFLIVPSIWSPVPFSAIFSTACFTAELKTGTFFGLIALTKAFKDAVCSNPYSLTVPGIADWSSRFISEFFFFLAGLYQI